MWGCKEDPAISVKHCSSFPVIVTSVKGPKAILKMKFRNLSNFMNSVVHDVSVMVQDRISCSLFYCNGDTASVAGKSGRLKIRGSTPLRGVRIKLINRIDGISI